MKKYRSVLGCMILLIMCLTACANTNTIVSYDGPHLAQDLSAILSLNQNIFAAIGDSRVKVKSIDGKEINNINNSNSNTNENTGQIELLPGTHNLEIEYFLPAHGSFTIQTIEGNYIVTRKVAASPRTTIAGAKIKFSAEAGHKYDLYIDRRIFHDSIFRCTIEDLTTGKIVYPPKSSPISFPLSEIPKNKAVVCFFRESGMLAVGILNIFENKKLIEELGNGSLVYHVTTPGTHNYTLGIGQRGPGESIGVTLAPGTVSYIHSSYWDLRLTLVQEVEALKRIRDLKNNK